MICLRLDGTGKWTNDTCNTIIFEKGQGVLEIKCSCSSLDLISLAEDWKYVLGKSFIIFSKMYIYIPAPIEIIPPTNNYSNTTNTTNTTTTTTEIQKIRKNYFFLLKL